MSQTHHFSPRQSKLANPLLSSWVVVYFFVRRKGRGLFIHMQAVIIKLRVATSLESHGQISKFYDEKTEYGPFFYKKQCHKKQIMALVKFTNMRACTCIYRHGWGKEMHALDHSLISHIYVYHCMQAAGTCRNTSWVNLHVETLCPEYLDSEKLVTKI